MASSTTASEKRIIGWIEDMIDEPLSSTSDLSVALSDGVALCKLVNKIRDGIVPFINTNPGVLNHLENISAYLQACWTLGVPTESIFGTQDLINRRNIPAVIKNLDALASVTVSNESVATSLPPTLTATSLSSDCSPAGTKTSIQIDPNEDLIAENEELTEENQNLRNRVRKMQEAVEECEAIISDKDKEISDLTEKLDKITEELHQAKDAISTNGHPVDPVELKARRLSRLESEIMTRGRANTELNNKVKFLEDENGKLQIEVVKLQQELARLQTQDASATSISSCNDDTEPGSLPGTATRERERDKERDKAENTKADKIARQQETSLRRSYAVSKPDGSPVATVTQDGEQGTSHYRHGMNLTPLSVSVPSSPSHSPSLSSSRHPPNKPLPLLPSHSSSSLASSSSSISSSSFSSFLFLEEHSLSSISSMPSRGDSDPNIISPRRRPETPQTPGTADPNKRKNLAARTFKGLKDKLGKKSARGEKVDQEDLRLLLRTIFTAASTLTFQDMVKVNFKKERRCRLFSLILDQEINAFSSSQKAYGLTPHSFDLLLYLVNASLQAMGEDTEHTDTIALQILMRSAFFFFKKDRGVVQFMHEHIREHDVWKRYVFWEEYFYSEIGNHAKLRKDDPKLVFSVLSEFLIKMRDFGVSAGLVQKLVNDVASKEEYKLTKDEVNTIMATSNPNPTTPTTVASPTTVPVMLRHTFLQKSTKKPAWCDFCNEFVWAVARIVYSCSECKFTIHKKCLDECLPHSACSSKKTLVVGTPFDVAHKVNVTKNANGGYEGLPKEWQDILEQSGIDQSDVLANPHAVLHIMEYHTQQQRKVTDKILPTPNLRQNRPLPPLPPPRRKTIVSEDEKDLQREGEDGTKEETDIDRDPTQAAPIPGLEETEDIEPSQYAIDDIVTPDNPAALYRDITQIGQGANAEVFSGFSIKSGNKVAIKKIKWDASKSNALINEIQIMKSSIHSNVICCTDCFLFEGELWVIMEFVDYGSLTDILDQYPRGLQMNEPEIAFVCAQTLKALEYIHSQGIIHRDIKTDNILLGLDGRVLLADFGSAARLTPARPVRKTVIGSPYWMAPELIRGEEYSQKVDIFSLGCTLQELAVGEPPFSEFPPLKALFSLATSDVPPIKNEDKKWTPLFMDFFNKCVRKDPAMRPTATDLMMHPFLGVACKQEEFSHNVITKAISYRDSMLSVFG